MAALAEKLAPRIDEAPLLISRSGVLEAQTALETGLAADLGAGTKLALSISDPKALIQTLLAADGVVPEMLLISYSQPPEVVHALMEASGADVLISDRAELDDARDPQSVLVAEPRMRDVETRWLMTTSGTTGVPKIIPHTLKSLARTVYRGAPGWAPVWGQLYDPTRFAGMQVTLQALMGGQTLVAVDTNAPLRDQVAMLAESKVTHLSGTPTLWRRLLMVPEIKDIPLEQATLGGEIVDQAILDALKSQLPDTRVTHIYASTEAGVGFSVKDGRAGFPASFLESGPAGVEMSLRDDVLWLKPPSGGQPAPGIEVDEAGFICSGDRIKSEGDRLYFLGRDSGMMNIGGVKIYPEAVERVILEVEGVLLANVSSKANPMTGALVVVDIQPAEGVERPALKKAIQDHCRAKLEREAVPAVIRFHDKLETNAAGKLLRKAKG